MLCVVGLDYLSTLAYQPSIAFSAAGRLAPLVTVLVATVTVFLALPIYWYIAGRSPKGGGSTALLERVVPGWSGKLLLLVLLSFGAVDLVFTRTFSAATAAEHITHSPDPAWQRALNDATREGEGLRQQLPQWARNLSDGAWNRQTVVTLIVLVIGTVVGVVFFKGYTRSFVRIAVLTVFVYLAMTLFIIGSGAAYLSDHPQLVESWWADVWAGNWKPGAELRPVAGWGAMLAHCLPLFPALALGLSGFELALMAMPLVRGRSDDNPEQPRGQIRNTRIMLTMAALTMSAYLLGSTLVTTVLIPPAALVTDGQAKYRALSYLAHGGTLADGQPGNVLGTTFGITFGTAYDVSTVAILALAGLSFAMTLSLWIPPYLARLGMEFKWSVRLGFLVYLFTGLKFAVTAYYGADVDAHRAAYLTGMLAVFGFGALAAAVDVWQKRQRLGWRKLFRIPPLFIVALLVFALSLVWVIYQRPIGAAFAGGFILVTVVVSIMSRTWRSTELRFDGFEFADKVTEHEWARLKKSDYPMLIPIRPGNVDLKAKEIETRTRHRIPGGTPIMFVQAEIADPSEFHQKPMIRITRENGRVMIHITRCCSVSHALAAAALEIASDGAVPEVHFGWSAENPVSANLHFVLFGNGNVPWMVYTLISRAEVPEDRKPRVSVA
ncbi:MAG: amino acid transporter [Planctomycetaceae bacterium]|nr:amino acid transporter [Planctomycetaceae bacterium]